MLNSIPCGFKSVEKERRIAMDWYILFMDIFWWLRD